MGLNRVHQLTGMECRQLLVTDSSGLLVAPLDGVDVDPVDPATLLAGAEPELGEPRPVGESGPLGESGLVGVSPLTRPGRIVAGDELTPHHPVVLRQHGTVVLAWDDSAVRHVSLRAAHLAVLDQLRNPMSGADLAWAVEHSAWDVAEADVFGAVVDLESLGLVSIVSAAGPGTSDPSTGTEPLDASGTAAPGPPASPPGDQALIGVLEDLPRNADAVRVVAYRLVGRARRWLRRRQEDLAGRIVARAVDTATDQPTDRLTDTAPDRLTGDDPVAAQLSEPTMPDGASDGSPQDESRDEVAETRSADAAMSAFDARTPVFGVYYSPEHNASLGLGMIMAYARVVDDGALNVRFDLRRASIDAEPMLDELRATGRHAVVLCSDFMWSISHNLEVSRAVKEANPRSIVVHGGPHAPSYEADAERFLAEHPEVDILVRGEGEHTIAELLAALGPDADPARLHEYVAEVEGITYRHHHGDVTTIVRTPDRARASEMGRFPSPYLTGEFADVDPARWRSATVESNRGCPYGCTFCDWGQATMSRIRKFDLDRVKAELEWIAARGISEVFLADSNFGIYERDVDLARYIAELKETYGAPQQVICSFAKNTVKYTTQIVKIWVDAGICAEGSVALQTTDPVTLRNVERSNIKVEKYDALAEEFRSHKLPIVTDLLMGLPGATVESFKADLQRCLDQDVTPRMMETVLLPNSPMNAPAYRERFAIELDAANVLVATSSYSREDFEEMKRLRLLFRSFEHFGLLRHVLRWLQYERELPALDVIHEIDRAILADPHRYPLMTWVGRYFDLVTAPPCGWPPFYDEVRDLLADRFDLHDDPELDTVLDLQLFLMPRRGRSFPDHLELDHDYVAWLDDRQHGTVTPLRSYGPRHLVVEDPAGVCESRILRNGFSIRREEACDNPFWVLADWELDSALSRPMATAIASTHS